MYSSHRPISLCLVPGNRTFRSQAHTRYDFPYPDSLNWKTLYPRSKAGGYLERQPFAKEDAIIHLSSVMPCREQNRNRLPMAFSSVPSPLCNVGLILSMTSVVSILT